MKYFSMFSGIGGFELGIERTTKGRWECIGFSEIDKYAIQTYTKNFPTHFNYGDAKRINTLTLPQFDLLVAGFPCQAFSLAGKWRGFEDTRGTLFFEIARIIKDKKPSIVFLENVKGILSHNKGETFRIIIQTLEELGYDVQWMVLNSRFFGVPQNRERVFIIGFLRGNSQRKVLSFQETYRKINKQSKCELSTQPKVFALRAYPRNSKIPHGQRVEINKENIVNTLTGMKKDNQLIWNGIRYFTPIEYERLQGFPDNWTEGVPETQRYKQVANAVTVNIIEVIIGKLDEQCITC